MNLTTILLVALSNDGYWLGGRTETVGAQWAVEQPIDGVTIEWRLVCGDAVVASGQLAPAAGGRPATIRLTVPRVRVHTAMRLTWRAQRAGQTKPVAEGSAAVEVYPDDLLAGAARRLAAAYLLVWQQPSELARHVFVWDRPEGLPSLLKQAKIAHTRIAGEAQLSLTAPDVVIVGEDQLGADGSDQEKLLKLAASGANVLVLNQTRAATLAGYALTRRAWPAELAWLQGHPLTASLRRFDGAGGSGDVRAIRLPADEGALEIAWWPREASGKAPAPIDALVVNKSVGRGRLVLCQMPLGPWQSDPRSQLFLADALEYLASPVVPTPPPSRRPQPSKPLPAPRNPSVVLP